MYACINSFIRAKAPGSKITERLVNDIPVRTLVEENSVAHLILTHPAATEPMGLDLFKSLDLVYSLDPAITVDNWLISLGDVSLPTEEKVPKLVKAKVKYNDLVNAGFDPQLAHPTIGSGNELPLSDLTDILVSKLGMDYEKVYRNCLFTVNGLFHIADYRGGGVLVSGAGRSVQHSNRNQLGILSFQALGEIKSIPIEREMIKPLIEEGPLRHGFSLHLPDHDLDNKTVLLSIAGILHVAQHHYRVTGNGSVVIEWWKIPFSRIYNDTKGLIDYAKFHKTLDRNPNAGDALDLKQAMSDESILAFMEMDQTFIILLDGDGFYVDREEVEHTGLPGRYYTYARPSAPLQLDTGLMPEYIAKPEGDTWTIIIDDNAHYDYLHESRPPTADNYVNSGHTPAKEMIYSTAWLLEMGRNYLV